MPRRRPTLLIAVALVSLAIGAGGATFALLAGTATTTVVRNVTVPSSQIASTTSSLSVGQIYKQAYRGVVEITVTSTQTARTPSVSILRGRSPRARASSSTRAATSSRTSTSSQAASR